VFPSPLLPKPSPSSLHQPNPNLELAFFSPTCSTSKHTQQQQQQHKQQLKQLHHQPNQHNQEQTSPADSSLKPSRLCSALLCSGSSALARSPQSTAVDASSINNPSVLRPHTLGRLEELGLGAGAFSCVFPSADLI
jgi:hypothetical protein